MMGHPELARAQRLWTFATIVAVQGRSFTTEAPQDDDRLGGFFQTDPLPVLFITMISR
jgi:hypothetical protein